MKNSDEDNFEKLIKILEYIYLKCENKIDQNDQYYVMYGKCEINELIDKFQDKYKECEKILNQVNYNQNPLFNYDTLTKIIEKLGIWSNSCKNYKYYFNKAKYLTRNILNKNNMIIENSVVNANDISHNKWEEQKMLLDKQKVSQAQDLALLNDNFGRALSSLECYANRFSNKKLSNIFNYYNLFNLGNTQNLVELQKKAFVQTQIFRLAYDDYINRYKKYDPPQELKLTDIKKLLEKWMYYVDNESKIIYQGMINVISSLNNSSFDRKFRAASQKYKNAKMDPRKISSFAAGVNYYNHQRCQEAKKYYMKKGKITSNLNINKNYTDDKNGIHLQNNIQNNKFNLEIEQSIEKGDFK